MIDKYGQTAALQMMADRESDESSSSEEEDDEGDVSFWFTSSKSNSTSVWIPNRAGILI